DISQIEQAFTSFARERPDALFVGSSPFFTDRRVQFALLAVLRKLPAAYPWRDFAEVGGLLGYGARLCDAIRQVGFYTGRIIKGAKPGCSNSSPLRLKLISTVICIPRRDCSIGGGAQQAISAASRSVSVLMGACGF